MNYGSTRRPEPADHAQALALLSRGVSAQNVSRMTGVYAPALLGLAEIRYRASPPVVPRPAAPVPQTPAGRVHRLLMGVAIENGITVIDLKGHDRKRRYAWPRQEAMHALEQQLGLSRPHIGRILGGRDHTTVRHGIRQHLLRKAAVEPVGLP